MRKYAKPTAGRVARSAHGKGNSDMSNSGTGPVVSFENVSKQYGGLKAVDGLNLDLRPGETVALLGPNGAGKSTSLDMLLALKKPTSGRIRMFGSDPYHAIKSGRVGAMLQSGGLMPEVTVRELVSLVASLHPRPLPVETTMKQAGIDKFADQRVDKLSGGQTQRVRFALAIAGECELIVLDEPTTAMDVETRRLFWANMKAEVAEGRTLLFATHYLEEADQAADRILVINKGRLLADGTPAEIKERAGAKRMSFRLERVDEPFLLGLPGLESLEITARRGADPDQGLRRDPLRGARRRRTGRPRSRSPASASSRRSSRSHPKTTGPATRPPRPARDPPREPPREEMSEQMSSTSGTLALGKAEIIRLRRNKRYLFFTLALPDRALPVARQDGGDRGRRPLQDLLPVRDGLARRVQRGVQQQRDPHLPGAEGRLDQAAPPHLPARQQLRGRQDHRDRRADRAADRDHDAARPVLRRHPAADLGVDGDRARRSGSAR